MACAKISTSHSFSYQCPSDVNARKKSLMSFIKNLNKKFNKEYDGQVAAHEEGGCLVLSGQLAQWSDVVHAGMMAIDKNPNYGFVNDIECTGETPMPIRTPRVEDSAIEWEEPDVLIIGGGIIGCAIARELSRYNLEILLVEKEHDLAMQASGRNSGLIQSGAGLKKTSLKYRFARLGNEMYESVCSDLGVTFTRSGQFVHLKKRLWDPFLPLTKLYWKWLGFKNIRVIRSDELQKYEPAVKSDIRSALYFPSAGVVNPFDMTIAYAENAVQNGVSISFDTMVQSMVTEDGVIKSVKTNRGTVHPKVVINAAGVFCDTIASMAGDRFFSIHPKKGTTAVIDKRKADSLIQTVISSIGKTPAKKRHTRDCKIVRTIDGTALIGPDSFETINKEDFSTSPYNINEIFSALSKIIPSLDKEDIIAYYSGISAATYNDDFIVGKGMFISNIIHAAGLQAPGLTAAPAISTEICKIVVDMFGGESTIGIDPDFDPKRISPSRPALMDDSARSDLIEANPDYGIIVCKCEEISKGEVLNALRRNVKCFTQDGVKRRVRAGMGRCHGSCCDPKIIDIIATEKHLTPQNVRKSSSGSEMLYGNPKVLLQKRISAASRISERDPTDQEALDNIHKRAQALQLANENARKDYDSDVDE